MHKIMLDRRKKTTTIKKKETKNVAKLYYIDLIEKVWYFLFLIFSQTLHAKCLQWRQNLFSGKKSEKYFKMLSAECLPSMLSIN